MWTTSIIINVYIYIDFNIVIVRTNSPVSQKTGSQAKQKLWHYGGKCSLIPSTTRKFAVWRAEQSSNLGGWRWKPDSLGTLRSRLKRLPVTIHSDVERLKFPVIAISSRSEITSQFWVSSSLSIGVGRLLPTIYLSGSQTMSFCLVGVLPDSNVTYADVDGLMFLMQFGYSPSFDMETSVPRTASNQTFSMSRRHLSDRSLWRRHRGRNEVISRQIFSWPGTRRAISLPSTRRQPTATVHITFGSHSHFLVHSSSSFSSVFSGSWTVNNNWVITSVFMCLILH